MPFFGDWVARQPLWVRIVVQWTLGVIAIAAGIRTDAWWAVAVGVIALTSPFWPFVRRRGNESDGDDTGAGLQRPETRSALRVSVARRRNTGGAQQPQTRRGLRVSVTRRGVSDE